ncbi:MAG: hypothetical protein RLZ51_1856 [Pseudomonadota bacterium]
MDERYLALLDDPRILRAAMDTQPVMKTDAQGRAYWDRQSRFDLDELLSMAEALSSENRVTAYLADKAMDAGLVRGTPEYLTALSFTPVAGVPQGIEDIRLMGQSVADQTRAGNYGTAAAEAALTGAMVIPSLLGLGPAAKGAARAADGLLSDAAQFVATSGPAVKRSIVDFAVGDGGALTMPGRAADFGDGWSDVYHWSRSPEDFTAFDLDKSTGSTSRLGPHVGTQRAAEDRFMGWEEPTGFTIPLKADLSRPFNNPSTGKPWTELDLEMFISAMADEHGIDRRDVPPMMRRRLADEGFTSLPYINDVEDPGSVSNIMLTDRGGASDAVLRSRFAAFDPRRARSENLSAALAGSAPLFGLLGLRPEQEQY